jgi:hypothetical protein
VRHGVDDATTAATAKKLAFLQTNTLQERALRAVSVAVQSCPLICFIGSADPLLRAMQPSAVVARVA